MMKISSSVKVVVLALAVAAVGGCGSKEEPVQVAYRPSIVNPDASNPPEKGKKTTIGKMAPDDVIVWVDGSALTRRDFDNSVGYIAFQINQYKQEVKDQKKMQVFNMMSRRVVTDFVQDQLLVHEARARKLLTQEQLDERFATAARDLAKLCNVSVDRLKKVIPGGETALGKLLETLVWKKEMIAAIPPLAVVDDASVSNVITELKAANAQIAGSNALMRATLEKLRTEIVRTKADFEAMAVKHSKDPLRIEGEKGNWGAFGRDDFKKEYFNYDLGQAVFALKPGEISGVLEDGEGFSIVKFIEFDERDKELKEEDRDRILSRIFLPKANLVVIEPFDVMKKALELQMRNGAVEKELERLMGKAKIVYPHGRNFFGDRK